MQIISQRSSPNNKEKSNTLANPTPYHYLHHGKRLAKGAADRHQQKFTAFDHGTRVDIRDLFGAMPVRVKHRAALFAERADVEKEFRELIILNWLINFFLLTRR